MVKQIFDPKKNNFVYSGEVGLPQVQQQANTKRKSSTVVIREVSARTIPTEQSVLSDHSEEKKGCSARQKRIRYKTEFERLVDKLTPE